MKALLALLGIVLVAIFVVRQPDGGEAAKTGGKGTGTASAGSIGKRCTVYADAPVVDGNKRLIGPARYRCSKPDSGVDAAVFLQVSTGRGQWANIDSQPVAATGSDATRNRPEKARTVLATGDCAPGTYRTFVRGTVSNGDRAYPVEAVSDPVENPCGAP
jgi:hypothetical protein